MSKFRISLIAAVVVALTIPAHTASGSAVTSFSVSGFTGQSSNLSRSAQNLVGSKISSSSAIDSVKCTGYSRTNSTLAQRSLAQKRATATCNFIKKQAADARFSIEVQSTKNSKITSTVQVRVVHKAAPSNTETAAPQPLNPEAGWQSSLTSVDLQQCQIRDARSMKIPPNNVGFPLLPDVIPTNGTIEMVVIPVDFSDRPGGELPLAYLEQQTQEIDKWYRLFSGDKVNFKFQIGKAWVRAPKPDSEYVVPKNQANAQAIAGDIQYQMGQDIITAAGSQFDYTNVSAVFFYFPTSTSVEFDMGNRGRPVATPQGTKPLFFWGGGQYHFDNRNIPASEKRSKMWAFWIHEMLHSQDQALHAPGNGFSTGLGQDQYGTSLTIGAWEMFRLGWLPNSSVTCLDKSSGTGTAILRPLENGAKDLRTMIVRVSEHQALVVESRRAKGYSSEWGANRGGVLVYEVDTRRNNDRSGEATGDTGNDKTYPKWAFYLGPQGKNVSGATGRNFFPYFLVKGDYVEFEGVKISVKETSVDGDLVEFQLTR